MYKWSGARPVEVLLSLTTTSNILDSPTHPSQPHSLPSLSHSLKTLFSDKSSEQAIEFDNILSDRLSDFLSISPTCHDLSQHLHYLEQKYHNSHFDTSLVQFFDDFSKWLGVASLLDKSNTSGTSTAPPQPRYTAHEPLPSPQLSHPANPLSIAALLGPSDADTGDTQHSHSQAQVHAHGSAKWFVLSSHAPCSYHDDQQHAAKRSKPTLPSFNTNAYQVANASAFNWPGPYGL